MTQQVFYSFHYEEDSQRAAQVRNMQIFEDNRQVIDNEWEDIAKGSDQQIRRWIDDQLDQCSCTIVLIGEYTA